MLQCKLLWICLVALPLANSQDGDTICQQPNVNFTVLPISDICGARPNISQHCNWITRITECNVTNTTSSQEIFRTFVCNESQPYLKIECLSGNTMVINDFGFECHANGQSIAEDLHCTSRNCGQFGEIENGDSSLELMPINGSTYHTKMRVKCHNGYVLQGWPLIDCDEHPTWADQKPTCKEVKCGSLPGLYSSCILESDVKYLDNGETKVILSCFDENESISVTRSDKLDAYCNVSGKWTNEVTCYCDCLIPEGIKKYNTKNLVKGKFLKHGDVLDWDCPKKYKKANNRTFQCMDGHLIFLEYSPSNINTSVNKIDNLTCLPSGDKASMSIACSLYQMPRRWSAYLNLLIDDFMILAILKTLF